jgi:hypothetical protein
MPEHKECICEPESSLHDSACECICHLSNPQRESQFEMNENEINQLIDSPQEQGE